MLSYTIDDPIESPLQTSVEVTIAFPSGPRWLFFVTPELLGRIGDTVGNSSVRVHLGAPHMVIVSDISVEIIDAVLRRLEAMGELEERTIALDTSSARVADRAPI